MKIVAAQKILQANDVLAEENRAAFTAAGVFCVNLLGSPGSGKTTLLEALLPEFGDRIAPAVIQGDLAGSFDAERIDALGVPVVQINTDGACHLDARMIAAARRNLPLERVALLVTENVGNLVCTAAFDLGEHLRAVVLSTTEGDDKVAKYPAVFRGCQALVITKMDLLPHTNFRVDRVLGDLARLAPEAEVFQVAAITGQGVPELARWVESRARTGCRKPRQPL